MLLVMFRFDTTGLAGLQTNFDTYIKITHNLALN